jgi:hypothetical protein
MGYEAGMFVDALIPPCRESPFKSPVDNGQVREAPIAEQPLSPFRRGSKPYNSTGEFTATKRHRGE